MAYTITPRNNRWNARSTRVRSQIEAFIVPNERWGSHRDDVRPAALQYQLAHGDYLRD